VAPAVAAPQVQQRISQINAQINSNQALRALVQRRQKIAAWRLAAAVSAQNWRNHSPESMEAARAQQVLQVYQFAYQYTDAHVSYTRFLLHGRQCAVLAQRTANPHRQIYVLAGLNSVNQAEEALNAMRAAAPREAAARNEERRLRALLEAQAGCCCTIM
jgi:hypothetical protein